MIRRGKNKRSSTSDDRRQQKWQPAFIFSDLLTSTSTTSLPAEEDSSTRLGPFGCHSHDATNYRQNKAAAEMGEGGDGGRVGAWGMEGGEKQKEVGKAWHTKLVFKNVLKIKPVLCKIKT